MKLISLTMETKSSYPDRVNLQTNNAITKIFTESEYVGSYTISDINKFDANVKDTWPQGLRNNYSITDMKKLIFDNYRSTILDELEPYFKIVDGFRYTGVRTSDSGNVLPTVEHSLSRLYREIRDLDSNDLFKHGFNNKVLEVDRIGFSYFGTEITGNIGELFSLIDEIYHQADEIASLLGKTSQDLLNHPDFIDLFARHLSISPHNNGIDIFTAIPHEELKYIDTSFGGSSFYHSWTEVKFRSITRHSFLKPADIGDSPSPFMYGQDIHIKMQRFRNRLIEIANTGKWSTATMAKYLDEVSSIYEAHAKMSKAYTSKEYFQPLHIEYLHPENVPTSQVGTTGGTWQIEAMGIGKITNIKRYDFLNTQQWKANNANNRIFIFPSIFEGKPIFDPGTGIADFSLFELPDGTPINMSNPDEVDYMVDRIVQHYSGDGDTFHKLLGDNHYSNRDDRPLQYRDISGVWKNAKNPFGKDITVSNSVVFEDKIPSTIEMTERGIITPIGITDIQVIRKAMISFRTKSVSTAFNTWADRHAITRVDRSTTFFDGLDLRRNNISGAPNDEYCIDVEFINSEGVATVGELSISARHIDHAKHKLFIFLTDHSATRMKNNLPPVDLKSTIDSTYSGRNVLLDFSEADIFRGSATTVYTKTVTLWIRGSPKTDHLEEMHVYMNEYKLHAYKKIDELVDNGDIVLDSKIKDQYFTNSNPSQNKVDNFLKNQLKSILDDTTVRTDLLESRAIRDFIFAMYDTRINTLKKVSSPAAILKLYDLSHKYPPNIADKIIKEMDPVDEVDDLRFIDTSNIRISRPAQRKKINKDYHLLPDIFVSEENGYIIMVFYKFNESFQVSLPEKVIRKPINSEDNFLNPDVFVTRSHIKVLYKKFVDGASISEVQQLGKYHQHTIDVAHKFYYWIKTGETHDKALDRALFENNAVMLMDDTRSDPNYLELTNYLISRSVIITFENNKRSVDEYIKNNPLDVSSIYQMDDARSLTNYMIQVHSRQYELFESELIDKTNNFFDIIENNEFSVDWLGQTINIQSKFELYHFFKNSMIREMMSSSSKKYQIYANYIFQRSLFGKIISLNNFDVANDFTQTYGTRTPVGHISTRDRNGIFSKLVPNDDPILNAGSNDNSMIIHSYLDAERRKALVSNYKTDADLLTNDFFGIERNKRSINVLDEVAFSDNPVDYSQIIELSRALLGTKELYRKSLVETLKYINNKQRRDAIALTNPWPDQMIGDFHAGRINIAGEFQVGTTNAKTFIQKFFDTNDFLIKILENNINNPGAGANWMVNGRSIYAIGFIANIVVSRLGIYD